jgi:Zn-dependent protease
MFRHSISIGRIFGIQIDLDYSWFLIAGLLAWILAASYFPSQFRGWSPSQYWVMGIATSILLFASVLIHELGHSVVAIHYGLSVKRITLFIFGGVSEITTEPPNAAAEFWIAIIGPLVSFALGALCWELEPLFAHSVPVVAMLQYLAMLNVLLGAFNLIPGFPLDGGRVFRAVLWRLTGQFQRASLLAATTGRFFGFLFIFLGVWQALTRNVLNGLWIAFIGWFLESAAVGQIRQETVKNLLGNHVVRDAMERDFPHVTGNVELQELVDRHVLSGGARCLVVDGDAPSKGLVTLSNIRKVPRPAWPVTHVSDVMIPLEKLQVIAPNALLWTAVEKMGRDGVNQLPVVENGEIVGLLTREDVLHYLSALQALNA